MYVHVGLSSGALIYMSFVVSHFRFLTIFVIIYLYISYIQICLKLLNIDKTVAFIMLKITDGTSITGYETG
jgi:hypothetical protein